jgi:hypothetical protein
VAPWMSTGSGLTDDTGWLLSNAVGGIAQDLSCLQATKL